MSVTKTQTLMASLTARTIARQWQQDTDGDGTGDACEVKSIVPAYELLLKRK